MKFLARAFAGALLLTPIATADTIFSDGTFNLLNYTQTSAFTTPGTTIVASQCASCGDPGNALEFDVSLPDSTSGLEEGALGVINKTFSYNPSTQGTILSISASVDKNLETSLPNATNLTNTFRPLIEQDGHIYLAAISGPTLTTGGSGGSTGFDLISQVG